MSRFHLVVIFLLVVLNVGFVWAEENSADAKKDTVEKFAQRYFDAFQNGNKGAYKKLWVTESQLRGFLEQMVKQQPPRKKFDIDEYVTESMKQAANRMERELREIGAGKFSYEIVDVSPIRMDKSGVMCSGLEITQRDLDTNEEQEGHIPQEMLFYKGRWYFFEKP